MIINNSAVVKKKKREKEKRLKQNKNGERGMGVLGSGKEIRGMDLLNVHVVLLRKLLISFRKKKKFSRP